MVCHTTSHDRMRPVHLGGDVATAKPRDLWMWRDLDVHNSPPLPPNQTRLMAGFMMVPRVPRVAAETVEGESHATVLSNMPWYRNPLRKLETLLDWAMFAPWQALHDNEDEEGYSQLTERLRLIVNATGDHYGVAASMIK